MSPHMSPLWAHSLSRPDRQHQRVLYAQECDHKGAMSYLAISNLLICFMYAAILVLLLMQYRGGMVGLASPTSTSNSYTAVRMADDSEVKWHGESPTESPLRANDIEVTL